MICVEDTILLSQVLDLCGGYNPPLSSTCFVWRIQSSSLQYLICVEDCILLSQVPETVLMILMKLYWWNWWNCIDETDETDETVLGLMKLYWNWWNCIGTDETDETVLELMKLYGIIIMDTEKLFHVHEKRGSPTQKSQKAKRQKEASKAKS